MPSSSSPHKLKSGYEKANPHTKRLSAEKRKAFNKTMKNIEKGMSQPLGLTFTPAKVRTTRKRSANNKVATASSKALPSLKGLIKALKSVAIPK